jgi:hypothetical protein
MGIPLFRNSCAASEAVVGATQSPNPRNFKIIKAINQGSSCVAWVNYPECTNFEGNKIIVFQHLNVADLGKMIIIDPHFAKLDPCTFARFVPTQKGWNFAVQLARQLSIYDMEKQIA